jgi:hypothetical protein
MSKRILVVEDQPDNRQIMATRGLFCLINRRGVRA